MSTIVTKLPLDVVPRGTQDLLYTILDELQNGGGGGSGTVTTISVASANGLAGSVANPTTTPVITLSTSVTGILKGNGTAISAASASELRDAADLASTDTATFAQVNIGSGGPAESHLATTGPNGTALIGTEHLTDDRVNFWPDHDGELLTDQSPLNADNITTGIIAPPGWKDTWKAALAAKDTTPAWLTVIGDSIATGAYADTTWFADGWVSLLRDALCEADLSGLYAEYIPALMHNTTSARGTAADMPWSDPDALGPNVDTQAGWHSIYYYDDTNVELQRFTVPYDCIDAFLFVSQYADTADYQINSDPRVTFGPPTYSREFMKIPLGALVAGDVVKVGWQGSANYTRPAGITLVKATTGVGVGRFTVGNARLTTYASYGQNHYPGGGGAFNPGIIEMWAGENPMSGVRPITYSYGFPTQPHLAIIALGVNDIFIDATSDDYWETLSRTVAGLRRGRADCSVLIMLPDYPEQEYSDTTSRMETPAAPAVSVQGTPGLVTYLVKMTWESWYGETLASASTTVTTGPTIIDGTDFLRVTTGAPPLAAKSVFVYVSVDAGSTWQFQNFAPASSVDFTNMSFTRSLPSVNGSGLKNWRDWRKFTEAAYAVADQYGCAVLNLSPVWGSNPYQKGYANGFDLHPTLLGHAKIAELVTDIVG